MLLKSLKLLWTKCILKNENSEFRLNHILLLVEFFVLKVSSGYCYEISYENGP